MKAFNPQIAIFSKRNVSKQLRTLYILAIVVPILIVGGIIYFIYYGQVTENYEHLTSLKARQVQSALVSTTLYTNNVYTEIMADSSLQSILSEEYDSPSSAQKALASYQKLSDVLSSNTSLVDARLYIDESFLASKDSFNNFYPITDAVKESDWYKKAKSSHSNFWSSSLRTDSFGTSYQELHYFCRIPVLETGDFGILMLSVSNDHLKSLIQRDEYQVYISCNEDPVFYCSDRSKTGQDIPVDMSLFDNSETTGQLTVAGEKVIASTTSLTPYATEDTINILVVSPAALKYIHRLTIIFALTLLFAIAISGFIISLYSGYFNNRIQTLRLAMHKVSHNDYEIVNSITGDDELSATFSDLVTMVDKLKATEAAIYQAQINEQILSNQQQQMELKLLASQINPHFLYNTLETIRMKAFSEGNREVATAIKLLGKSMRYVLSNTKASSTTLDKEIDYIRTYLAIQQIRFGSRLKYTIRIEDNLELSNYQILPLLIQPIVENAFSHGLKDAEYEGHIIIKLSRDREDPDLLVTDVFDNGIGMTADQLAEVIAHLDVPREDSDHGVGLYNINNRVHLFYGDSYGLELSSRPNLGTVVTLTIPLINIREEEA